MPKIWTRVNSFNAIPTPAMVPMVPFFQILGSHKSFLWGHWYSCFGLLVMSSLGYKFRVDPSLVCFVVCTQRIPLIPLWCNTSSQANGSLPLNNILELNGWTNFACGSFLICIQNLPYANVYTWDKSKHQYQLFSTVSTSQWFITWPIRGEIYTSHLSETLHSLIFYYIAWRQFYVCRYLV